MYQFNTTSHYGELFNIQFKEYTGIDYAKVAFIFPGQGAAKPGMLKNELKKIPHCLKRFSEADQWSEDKKIGKISWYITSPHLIEKSHFYTIQNLALYVLEVGLFENLKASNKNPAIITAHSFGEYAALVSSGALDFFSMLDIVYHRELFSPKHDEIGLMFALSCDVNHFTTLQCTVPFHMANENSHQQFVISISIKHKNEMIQFLKKSRIPFRELDTVGRPYHCSLMKNTCKQMSDWLQDKALDLTPLEENFISSVNNNFYKKGYLFSKNDFIKLVTDQLTMPVYFTKQIQNIINSNIHSFLEIGLSGIYCDFIKNITLNNPESSFSIQTLSILFNTDEEKKKIQNQFRLDLDKSPTFKVLTKYISHITGYDLVEIGVDDYFQEDLRIDSIKKAEIIFKTLEETNTQIEESLSLAQMRSVGEVVEFLEKMQQSPLRKKKKENKVAQKDVFTSLIPTFVKSPRASLFNSLKKNSDSNDYLKIALDYTCANSAKEIYAFYYSQSPHTKHLIFDFGLYENRENTHSSLDYFIRISREIKKIMLMLEKDVERFEIILTSQKSSPEFHAFSAFFKSLCREYGFFFKSIEHDITSDQENNFWQMIHNESEESFGIDIKYLQGQRFTKQWIPLELKNISKHKVRTKMIIIGGAKGLAFELFSRIKKSPEIELIIWGRSSPQDLTVEKNIKILNKRFKKAHYLQVDALQNDQFQEAMKTSMAILGNIDLLINSAGIELSKLFIDKSEEEIQLEASTKIQITDNIKNDYPNNHFDVLHFSSIVGSFGNEGQSIYAYGNAYQSQSKNSVSIQWPGLNQIGMTENLGILHKLKMSGIHLLDINDAATWFDSFLQMTDWGTRNPNAFKGTITYMDPKDIFLMEFFMRDLLKFNSTTGELISPQELIFRKIYNSQIDSYLQDHVIESTSVVPASSAISSMLCFGHLFYKSFPVLNHFEIKNIMMLLDGRDVTCYTQYHTSLEKNNDKSYIKLSSLMTSQIEHFTGTMTPQTDYSLKGNERQTEFFNFQIELDAFYSKKCIGFGNKFQNLENIYYSEHEGKKNILGIGKSAPIYYTGLAAADAIISMLECSFQTVSCFGIILGKGLAIPLRFSKLHIEKLEFEKIVISPDILEINKGQDNLPLKSNVTIYNEKNEVLMIIENLEMSTIRHHPTPPFKLLKTSREL